MRRLGYHLLLFVGALAVALVCLEIGFRVARRSEIVFDRLGWESDFDRDLSVSIYKKSDEFDFSTTTNRFGFRGPQTSVEKPAGVKRVMVLGDSNTFGWGVNDDDVFTARLQRRLGGAGIEIINASSSALSPLVYYARLKNNYIKLDPDLVLVFVNFGDIREDFIYKKNIVRDAKGAIADVDPAYVDGKQDFWRWVRSKSEFCSYTFNKLERTLRKIEAAGLWAYVKSKFTGEKSRPAASSGEGADESGIEDDPFFLFRDTTGDAAVRRHVLETMENLHRMQRLLAAKNVPLLVISLPNGLQVGQRQWSRGREVFGFQAGKVYDRPLVREIMKNFSASHGIGYLDLTATFQQDSREPLFYERDGHMRPAGHQIIAAALLQAPEFRSALALP